MNQASMALDIQNVTKNFKNKKVLLPFHYQLPKGKILALCGGNGAGKSTLIRLITGILEPTTGHVTMNQLNKHKHKKRFSEQFGYMPDNFHFQHSMTTKETIKFYAEIKNMNKQRYKEVLNEVGLLNKLHVKVGEFSKGMNQRLLLAQALLAKPSILILDEPTNGLDPYWLKKFCELMLQAKQNGQTVILSTHDLNVAEQIADEVIFLANGSVISAGSIDTYHDIGLHETFQQLYLNINHSTFK